MNDWLELYPDSLVKYEERVKETNQIADVMVTHPDGKRWAFEFQCYLLTDAEWKARHNLYKKAGLTDFWVFGDIAVHNYAESPNSSYKNYHKLKAMESAVWDSGSPLYYLNTETEILCIIDEGKYFSDTVLNALEFEGDFSGAFIKECQWYSPTRLKKVEARRLELLRIKEAQRLAEEEKQRKLLAWEKKQRVTPIEKELHLATLMTQRDNFTESFTPKEKELFLKLSQKHGYNRDTFPGILQVEVNHLELIETPIQLWQLWIYDQHIAGRVSKSSKTPFINSIYILDGFKKLKADGYIRLAWNPSSEYNYTFALYDYLKVLCNVGVLEKMGFIGAKKYKVLVDKIPTYADRIINIQQKLVVEDQHKPKTYLESTQSDHDYTKRNYSNNKYFADNASMCKFQADISKLQEESMKIISNAIVNTITSLTPLEAKMKVAYDLITQAKKEVSCSVIHRDPEIDKQTLKYEDNKLSDAELRKQYEDQKEEDEKIKIVAKEKGELAITNARLEIVRRRAKSDLFRLTERLGLTDNLNIKEKTLFLELCVKHGFSERGYPGILDVEVDRSGLIQTPNRVWQLWFYDRLIYKKHKSDMLCMTAIHKWEYRKPHYDFLNLRKNGIFRTSDDEEYRYAFYDYKDILVSWGIISPVGVRDYEILINEIPILADKMMM